MNKDTKNSSEDCSKIIFAPADKLARLSFFIGVFGGILFYNLIPELGMYILGGGLTLAGYIKQRVMVEKKNITIGEMHVSNDGHFEFDVGAVRVSGDLSNNEFYHEVDGFQVIDLGRVKGMRNKSGQ